VISNLLATKLHRPTALARPVRRAQLVRKLNEGLAAGRRLTLVSAPAGFGKTTCVSEWLNSTALPVAWLSLDAADDDPGRFFAYLVEALQGVDSGIGRELEGALQARQSPAILPLTTALLNDVLRTGARFCLVLDDFQTIHAKPILDAVEALITGGPDNLHLVLITREDPPLPLGRLRAHDKMTELRAGDLRFSEDEAGDLLNERMALSLSPGEVAALEKRTEGWVAGLQLAGLSVRGQADPAGFIARLSGSHRHILSYLTEEVLDRQPPDVRDFLLQTSILDRLSGELCDAVTARLNCAHLLEEAWLANLFLVPLDENGEWYRYHHLFGELLQTRLRQTWAAGEVDALHRRASAWLAAHGQADEAIRHALAGRDFEQAVALVDGVARGMIFAGRMHTLRNWILAFPAEFRAAYPRLEVYRTWIELLEGKLDFGERAAQAREEMLQTLPPSPENDRLRVELAAVLCRYSPLFGDTAAAIRLAHTALAAVDEADVVSRARLLFGLAVAHSLQGKAAESEAEFEECLRLATVAGDDGLAAEVLGLVAQDKVHCGHLGEAARLYRQIVDLPGRHPGEGPGADEAAVAGRGYLGLAEIYLERYELDRAEADLERGMGLCARGGLDGIYSGYGIRSRLRQVRGDLSGALADIETVQRTFHRGDDPMLATRRILIARAMSDQAEIERVLEPWTRLLRGAPGGRGARSPALVLDVVKALVAQGYLAQGQSQKALDLLAEMETGARQDGRLGLLIRVYLLQALALQAQHLTGLPSDSRDTKPGGQVCEEARQRLVRALELAEPEGYVLTFLEEFPAVEPLLAAVRDGARPGADDRVRRYAARLLAVNVLPDIPPQRERDSRPNSSDRRYAGTAEQRGQEPPLIEPLSGRELEILHLIGEGCTNQEISGRLSITLHTVKKHSSNIFGKLGVSSRTQAVARARRLGLIE
jgi:LuxR family transcriptional regulator, maltose regulon positive regulatory protein